jgi:peptide/nickel transport system permease protein
VVLTYLVKRVLSIVPVLLGISIVAFTLIHLVPGDTVSIILGTNTTAVSAAALRATFGLDRPAPVQYFVWLGGVLHGDFGPSLITGQAISSTIASRLPATMELTVAAMVLSLCIALPAGIIAAIRQYSVADYAGTSVALVGLSIPSFWLATILTIVFSVQWHILPPSGYVALSTDPVGNLKDLVLPAVTLGTGLAAVVMRYTRSAMLEVIRQEYIKTARIKGLPEKMVIFKHALRNALVPVVTVIGLQTAYLLGGVVIIEQIFDWPGIGKLLLNAVYQRDYPMVQGVILVIATLFVLINLVVDILYAYLNPRIRYA